MNFVTFPLNPIGLDLPGHGSALLDVGMFNLGNNGFFAQNVILSLEKSLFCWVFLIVVSCVCLTSVRGSVEPS